MAVSGQLDTGMVVPEGGFSATEHYDPWCSLLKPVSGPLDHVVVAPEDTGPCGGHSRSHWTMWWSLPTPLNHVVVALEAGYKECRLDPYHPTCKHSFLQLI